MARYYVEDKPTGFLKRFFLKKFSHMKPVPHFPKIIQIQTQSGCNARCAFCPSGKTVNKLTHGRMDVSLFDSLADECCAHRPQRISPYLMNEPLLDAEIDQRIAYLEKRRRPPTVIHIATNGSRLTRDMAKRLIDAGLDSIAISFQGFSKEVFEETMAGLQFEETFENVTTFLRMCQERDVTMKRRVTMVRTKLSEKDIEPARQHWTSLGAQFKVLPLYNRAHKAISSQSLNTREWRRFAWCNRMMTQAYILYNGDLVLCCVDWERSTIMGNVREHSLEEVWNNELYRTFRKRFLVGDVAGMLCAQCMTTGQGRGEQGE
mgnify:CR=1 FL=1